MGSIVVEFLEELNKRNLESSLFERFSEEVILDDINGKHIGVKTFKNYFLKWISVFPDYKIEIDQITNYKNTIIVSNINKGTHENVFTEPPDNPEEKICRSDFSYQFSNHIPEGKNYRVHGDIIFIISNDKIERVIFAGYDNCLFYRQLGLKTYAENNYQNNKHRPLIDRLQQLGKPYFTKKETICLSLNISGLSAKQIGKLTGNSHRTIECHLQHAIQKSDCFSKLDLIEKMIDNGTLPLWHDLCRLLLKLNLKTLPPSCLTL